jgi:hypothetical protein
LAREGLSDEPVLELSGDLPDNEAAGRICQREVVPEQKHRDTGKNLGTLSSGGNTVIAVPGNLSLK